MLSQSLSIIIPAYNEEKNIPLVIPQIIAFCREHKYRVIVVNDGSRDNSKAILAALASDNEVLTIINHKINRGYGGAIKSGIDACQTEYLVTMDCDGQHVAEDVKGLLDQLLLHDADMVVGSRKGLKSASISRSFGKRAIRFVIKRLMHLPIYDINSGMKLYTAHLGKKYCKICPDSMAYSDVICLTFVNKHHKVIEHPISIRERAEGQSTVNIKTAFHTIYEIFNIVVLFNPIRIFMPVALTAIFAGIIWEIPIFLKGRGISVGSMLSIMLGVITLFFAAVAEQLSQIRKKDI